MTHGRECGFADTTAAGELTARDTAATLGRGHGEAAGRTREPVGSKCLSRPGASSEQTASRASVDRALVREGTGSL